MFWKKLWTFIKTHWYLPILAIGLIVAVIIAFVSKSNSGIKRVIELFNRSRDKYNKEIEIIETNKKLMDEEKQKNKEQYDKALSEIEKKIKLKKDQLKEDKVKKLIEKYGDDYDSMAKDMADEYGFEVIE